MKNATKRLNVYKVVTDIPAVETEFAGHHGLKQVDYVRARSLAGAKACIARRYVSAELASQDDLLALAKIAVIEESSED